VTGDARAFRATKARARRAPVSGFESGLRDCESRSHHLPPLAAIAQLRSSRHPSTELRAAGGEEMTDKGSERLGDQLQRVIAKGLTTLEAERAICAGISAGEIVIYRRIEKFDSNGHTLFANRDRFWSSHLKYLFPEDFDWENSLFSARLQKLSHLLPPFRLKWIELSNEGIRHLCFEISIRQMGLQEAGAVNHLGNLAPATSPEPPFRSDGQEATHGFIPAARNGDSPARIDVTPSRRTKSRPLYNRARQVIDALFHGRVPGLADLSDRDLCELVRRNLGETKRKISDPTILRAAGRKRARMRPRPPV
jgi:hypothetical protein